MPKVSVIIPVYNTEKYLKKCLDSVCNQTLSDIEIICVNDCSPDNSLDILNEYAAKDSRIKVIDFKENKGAAVARNTGIDVACGEYIGFVDPDDFINLDFYEKLYTKALETDADCAKGTIHLVFDKTKVPSDMIKKIVKKDQRMMNRLHKKIQENKMYFRCMFSTAIYRKAMLDKFKIGFIENCICGEDLIVPLKTAIFSNKIELVDDAKYFYLRREYSATTSKIDENKIKSILLMQETILNFINIAPITKKHYRYIIKNYVDEKNYFYILLYYDKKQLNLINKIIDNHSKIKYRAKSSAQYYKILDKYLTSKDFNNFIKELKIYHNKFLIKKLREKMSKANNFN